MDARTWAAAKSLLADAAEIPATDRLRFIEEHCPDPTLRQALIAMLASPAPLSDVLGRTGLETGTTIGPYVIASLLGRGGMGEVYRARDTKLHRDVAIKVLPQAMTRDQERLARLRREAHVLAALNHPNIGHIYAFDDFDGTRALVLELVEGPTLEERIARGPVPVVEALALARQIAEALESAHEHGIIHRDLKPSNIKISPDGVVKVLDFGLAKAIDMSPTISERSTQAGMLVGTAAYMSPEQAAGRAADRRSDLWAFGLVLMEMLTGRPVFAGDTLSDVLAAVLTADPDWASLPANLPFGVERLLRRCLEKDRKARLDSAAVARFELDEAATSSSGARVPRRDVTFALEALPNASRIKQIAGLDAPTSRSGVSRAQVIGMALIVGSGAAAIWSVARFGTSSTKPPEITQLTFRSGYVRGARFAPDGQNVIYAASWEGQPLRMFSTRPGSPDSTPLALPDSDLMAVSPRTNELLATLRAKPGTLASASLSGEAPRTLARASLSGGAPRALAENVMAADFSPDGRTIAAIVAATDGFSLQFPLGTERVKTPYELSHLRIAPDGQQVAFLSHPLGGDEGDVRVLGRTGEPRTISTGWISLGGLAWAKAGKEVWFTATRKGGDRALWAVTLQGDERELYQSTERLTLEDVAPDGRALLSAGSIRSRVFLGSLHGTTDRDLSWFDFDNEPTLSADGSVVAFTESGEGAGSTYGVFVRSATGEAAVRVADGASGIISPDGEYVLAGDLADLQVAVLAPTGAGPPKRMELKPLQQIANWHWYPDSRHVILTANEPGHRVRSWRLDTVTGEIRAITPEGVQGRIISPNGRLLVAEAESDTFLLDLQTGAKVPLKGVQPGDLAVGFGSDGSSLYVFQVDVQGGRIFQIDPASGARTLVRALHADDPGFLVVDAPRVSLDGDHFAYSITSLISQLFLLKLAQ